ncbi:hypothetical protein [Nonomuraea endophytica]|uniref:Uncharacterized protein n=1 Tax=Nonomuraea endophytica TaxID=714136 RepID=A0A7W7ZWG3_9ACTN|nr:hypothetical protein [Nonomuraea endophytica]MBB5074601.1 hypothetical protein [Nonomuraea endophytica]
MIRYFVILALLAVAVPNGRNEAGLSASFAGRAEQALMTWRGGPGAIWQSGFNPRQDLTIMSPEVAAARFGNPDLGLVYDKPDVPSPATGTIRWADGHTLEVPLMPADIAAYRVANPRAIPGRPSVNPVCQGGITEEQRQRLSEETGNDPSKCEQAKVTRVTLEKVTVSTHRGPAEAPAWRFDVDGLPGPIRQVAVADAAVDLMPPGLGPTTPFDGSFEEAKNNTLTIHLISLGCDRLLGMNVREEPDAVVVEPRILPSDAKCDMPATIIQQPVKLSSPLGNRPVLDARTGLRLFYGPL